MNFNNKSITKTLVALGWISMVPIVGYLLLLVLATYDTSFDMYNPAGSIIVILENGHKAKYDNYALETIANGSVTGQIEHIYGGETDIGHLDERTQIKLYKLSDQFKDTHAVDQKVQQIVNEKSPECTGNADNGSNVTEACRKLGEDTRSSLLRNSAIATTSILKLPYQVGILKTDYAVNIDVSKNSIELIPYDKAAAYFPLWQGTQSIRLYLIAVAPLLSLLLFSTSVYLAKSKKKAILHSVQIWSIMILTLSALLWIPILLNTFL